MLDLDLLYFCNHVATKNAFIYMLKISRVFNVKHANRENMLRTPRFLKYKLFLDFLVALKNEFNHANQKVISLWSQTFTSKIMHLNAFLHYSYFRYECEK